MIEGAKRTLIDHLMELQQGCCLTYPLCPVCEYERHPGELIDTRDLPDESNEVPFICSHCLLDKSRGLASETDTASQEELWNGIKGNRNLLLEKYAWTIQRGSPLNTTCQKAYEELMKKLHKLTVTYATPAEVVWPEIPPLVYGD